MILNDLAYEYTRCNIINISQYVDRESDLLGICLTGENCACTKVDMVLKFHFN